MLLVVTGLLVLAPHQACTHVRGAFAMERGRQGHEHACATSTHTYKEHSPATWPGAGGSLARYCLCRKWPGPAPLVSGDCDERLCQAGSSAVFCGLSQCLRTSFAAPWHSSRTVPGPLCAPRAAPLAPGPPVLRAWISAQSGEIFTARRKRNAVSCSACGCDIMPRPCTVLVRRAGGFCSHEPWAPGAMAAGQSA
mgnify:CR=1 FL=1